MQIYVKRVNNAIKDLQKGKLIILTYHPDRENEGDLIFPAQIITPEIMNFIIRNTSGIVCLAMFEHKMKQLSLDSMVPSHENNSVHKTPFTVSIDAKFGITTGVSAYDRTKTVLDAVKEGATQYDIVKPGHVFPLQAKDNGVLARAGHTEGAVDIVRLAGFRPEAILCEIMNRDGTMAKGDSLKVFARDNQLSMLSIPDLINYRLTHENLIEEVTLVRDVINGAEHLVKTMHKIAIVVSQFNQGITDKLLDGAVERLRSLGITKQSISVLAVPGAIEIPLIAKLLAKTRTYEAIICLGAVIRGETGHYDFVCKQVSDGCAKVMLDFESPVVFGVLTTDNIEQALARSGGGDGNKGADAADVALQMIKLVDSIRR